MVTPDESEKKDAGEEASVSSQEPGVSFYQKLLRQPLCLRTGECNNCGRCEH